MFGVPGNHDYWSGASFVTIRKCFAATGGEWLLDQQHLVAGGKINLLGSAGIYPFPVPETGDWRKKYSADALPGLGKKTGQPQI